MPLPTKLVAWNFQLQTLIPFTSLVQVAREVMFTVKQRLVAQGWVVKGSSDGVTGAMDAVDRWVAATDAGTRFNGAAGVQSWIVLTDANGYDILFAYNSATDDVYKVAVSFTGNYVAAGTPTHQPTSTTEQLLNTFYTTTPGTIIGSSASGQRIVSVWTRPDSKGFRVAIANLGAYRSVWGVDFHAAVAYGAGVTVSHSAFYINTPSGLTVANSMAAHNTVSNAVGLQFRTIARRLDANVALEASRLLECMGPTAQNPPTYTEGNDFAGELQGGTEYKMRRIGLQSVTASHRGKICNLLDWWSGRTTGSMDGDTYGNREFVTIGGAVGLVWPWDGTPSVAGTPVVTT